METSSQSAGMIDSSSTLNSEADMDVVNELEKDIQKKVCLVILKWDKILLKII